MSFFSTPSKEVTRNSIVLRDPVFISDLHLNGDEPDTINGFLRFFQGREGDLMKSKISY